MTILKKSDRQELISAYVEAGYADFDNTIIGTASTSTMTAIELPANAIITSGNLFVDTPWTTEGVRATGTLTTTTVPLTTNTVTIDSVVYTFVAALSTGPTVPNEVLIGTETASNANLALAINAGSGIGTNYSTGTVIHPTVSATSTEHTVVVTAKVGGTAGNSLGTTETHAAGSWGGATLSGGVAAGDTFTVKIGSETYLSATTIDSAGRTALVPTGTKTTAPTTIDLVWDVANTTITAPTAGSATLQVSYLVDGRAQFSQG